MPKASNYCVFAARVAAEDELKNLQLRSEMLKVQQQIGILEESRHIDLLELDAAVPMFSGDDHYDIKKWFSF